MLYVVTYEKAIALQPSPHDAAAEKHDILFVRGQSFDNIAKIDWSAKEPLVQSIQVVTDACKRGREARFGKAAPGAG